MANELETIRQIAKASLMPDFFGARIDEEGLWPLLRQLLAGIQPAASGGTIDTFKRIAGGAATATDFIEKVKGAKLWPELKELVIRIQTT